MDKNSLHIGRETSRRRFDKLNDLRVPEPVEGPVSRSPVSRVKNILYYLEN